MSSKAKLLAKGSMLRIFSFFAYTFVALLLMPFVIHSLGDRMYGLWIVIGSFLTFYGLFDFGLSSAVQRYISRALGTEDHKEANIIANTTLSIYLLVGLCVAIISIVIAVLTPLIASNLPDAPLFGKIILILGASSAIGFPMRVFSGVLTSHLRYDLVTYIGLLKLVLRTVFVVIFLKAGYGILALALITFALETMGHLTTCIVSFRIAPYLLISRKFVAKTYIRRLFEYSSMTFIARLADRLRFNVDSFVIAAFVGLSSVTIYSIAARLVKYFMEFIMSAMGLMTPIFSQYEARGDYTSIREKFIFITKISGYLSFLVGGTLIIFGKAFIERWVGSEYIASYPVLIILVIPFTFALMQSPSIQLMYGISKHKFFAISNTIEGVANLVLSLILVRKLGLIGVALGTAIPMGIIKLVVQPIYTCNIIKLNIREYYFFVLVPILFRSLAVLFIIQIFIRKFIVPDFFALFFAFSFQLILFSAFVFLIGLNHTDRRYFKKAIFSVQ